MTDSPRRYVLHETCYFVAAVDSSPLKISQQLLCDLQLENISDSLVEKCTLGVIITKGEDHLLIGRQLASNLKLTINFETGEIRRLDAVLFQPADYVNILNHVETETRDRDCCDSDFYFSNFSSDEGLPLPLITEDCLQPKLDQNSLAKVKSIVDQLLKTGMISSITCPDFAVGFRLLNATEVKDHPVQQITAIFSVPQLTVPVKDRKFSASFYRKLTEDQKSLFNDLVKKFVDSKFWIPLTSVPHTARLLPESQVFIVNLDKGKPRLVVDARPLNKNFKRATSTGADIWSEITLIRILKPKIIFLSDARSAFYKVRLDDCYILLSCGDRYYASDRMIFGAAFGTGILSESYGKIITSLREHDQTSKPNVHQEVLLDFVDDVASAGKYPKSVITSHAETLQTLLTSGFDCSALKSSVICTEESVEEVNSVLAEHSLHVSVISQSKLLGSVLSFEKTPNGSSILNINCSREARLKSALKLLEDKTILSENSLNMTKSDFFSVCGSICFDPIGLHTVDCLYGDLIRSLIGKFFSKVKWDVPIDLTVLPFQLFEALKFIWSCIETSIKNQLLNPVCKHFITLGENFTELQLYSDSSMSGAGFILSTSSGVRLAEKCWRWRAMDSVKHINVREFSALLQGLRRVSKFIEYAARVNTSFLKHSIVKLEIFCDNKSTVLWSTDSAVNCRALERRTILRLASAVTEELNFLKTFIPTVQISHIKGISNETADLLSRVLDQVVPNVNEKLWVIFQKHLDKQPTTTFFPPTSGGVSTSPVSDFDFDSNSTLAGEDVNFFDSVDFVYRVEGLDQYFLRDFEENVRRVKETETTFKTTCLADRMAADCYNLDQLYWRWSILRTIFEIWKNKKFEAFKESFVETDLFSMVHSLQYDWMPKQEVRGLTRNQEGIWLFCVRSPDDRSEFQYYCPKHNKNFVRLLCNSVHRENLHPGLGTTLNLIRRLSVWFIPNLKTFLKSELQTCLTCQRLSAKQNFTGIPGRAGVLSISPEQMAQHKPYCFCGVDVYTLTSDFKILTVCCLSTGHCSWALLEHENSEGVVNALQRVQLREGGFVKILTDQASYFVSETFKTSCREKLKAECELVTPRSPWAGYFETIHRIASRAIRFLLKFPTWSKSFRANDVSKKLLFIETVVFYLNRRPLGLVSVDPSGVEKVLTPDDLRCGYTKEIGSDNFGKTESINLQKAREKNMQAFLTEIWTELRLNVLSKIGSSEALGLQINDRVLVRGSVNQKCAIEWQLGSIVRVISSRRYVVRWSNSGRVTEENSGNLLKLKLKT